MAGRLKFAIVGAGRIGLRHAKMVELNPEAELIAIVDSNAELKAEIESLHGVPFYSNTKDLFAAGLDIDIVNVCTPNYLHAKQSIEALENKCHVLVEKPMALSKKDAELVIHKSLQVNRRVFCVMQNRYSPPSKWLKQIIEEKRLGEIYLANVNCFWNRDSDYYKGGDPDFWKGKLDLDGGTLFTQFSHFIDMMYWLLGDIENISARFFDFNHHDTTEFEDSGIVQFDFVNGGAGSINYSTSVFNKNMESSMTIIGEKGSVKVGGQYMNEIVYCDIEGYEQPDLEHTLPPNDYGKYKGSASNHQFVIQNVVDALLDDEVLTTNSLEGMKVVEIIENIYKLKD